MNLGSLDLYHAAASWMPGNALDNQDRTGGYGFPAPQEDVPPFGRRRLFFLIYIFKLFYSFFFFGCVGSSLLHAGFL